MPKRKHSDRRRAFPTLVVAGLVAWLGSPASGIASADEAGAVGAAAPTHSFDPFTPCPGCRLLVGVGGTYDSWDWLDGLVIPITLELDQSRWELGAFRMARRQIATDYPAPYDTAANPYWGFSAMRRWQILHRSWARLYVGFGGSYKTETDYLNSTRWNFAYLIVARFRLEQSDSIIEVATRHWSNAYIKQPNRGQNFVTVSVSF